jgi:dihydroorotate dehydrogenase electron transfer subunit
VNTVSQLSSPVVSNREVMPGVSLIWLKSPQIASMAQPGQFVMVCCGEDTLLRRPFSIHRVDEDKTSLALLFSVVGKGTLWLSRCKSGDRIDLLGPLGNGFTIQPATNNILLVAGGIGIAPLFFLAQEATKLGLSAKMCVGMATATKLVINNLLPKGIKYATATEDGTVGHRGMITDLIPEYIDWADQIFACGPSPMYRSMAKMAELKEKPDQISLEVRMGCGLGVCYGCTVKTKSGLKQVCKDGPVFELNDILWDEFVDI